MTYRTSAEPARPVVVRRVPSRDPFRWPKVVFGAVCVAGTCFFAWTGVSNEVRCQDASCALVQRSMVRPTREYPFDARSAPPLATEPANVGKNGRGLRLLLRYPNADIEIFRGWPDETEAEARRVRAYLADPRGSLAVGKAPGALPQVFVALLSVFGLLVLLDGAKVLFWHRLRADPRAHTITLETVVFGATVARRSFPVSASTKLGTAPYAPDNPRARGVILTLEDEGGPPRRLPIFDHDTVRPIVLEMIDAAA